MEMKKIFMLSAVAALSLSAVSCKASDKDAQGEAVSEAAEAMDAVAESESGVALPEGEDPADEDSKASSAPDKDGYLTTASGLKYKVLREGTGKKPESSAAVVKVNYEGTHLDGTVFDSSYERGEAIEFPLNRVIPGWTEGVQLMKEGAKYEFLIPSGLAYGPTGTPGGPIKPNEDLKFVVELIEVK